MEELKIVFLFIAIPIAIFLMAFFYDSIVWGKSKKILDGEPISYFKNKKWLGFSHHQKQGQVLRHALRIGLISKVQYLDMLRQCYDVDTHWSSSVFINGEWFRRTINEIGFRFDIVNDRLIEIRIAYDCRHITPYTVEEKYDNIIRHLDNKYGEVWKKQIGVSICETKGDEKIYVTLFLLD